MSSEWELICQLKLFILYTENSTNNNIFSKTTTTRNKNFFNIFMKGIFVKTHLFLKGFFFFFLSKENSPKDKFNSKFIRQFPH